MAMTLKQAFTIWAYDQKNTVLAAKSRDAVQRVLLKKWNDIDLEQITESCARRIFTTSSAPQELKAKAASILVQLLQWGSEKGHCQPPSFSYDIASEDYGKEKKRRPRPVVPSLSEVRETVLKPEKRPDAPIVRVKPEALAKRKAELAARNEPKTDTTMEEKKKGGRKPRPLAQIDPHTLEVVHVWPTMKDAERALNACNLDRAAKMIRKSAGFYWSDVDQVATFRERLDAKERGISLEEKTACQPAPGKQDDKIVTAEPEQAVKAPVEQPQEAPSKSAVTPPAAPKSGFVDEEECQSRRTFTAIPGVEDVSVRNAAHAALEVFTDEELWKELERRGWQGEISRVLVIAIGKK